MQKPFALPRVWCLSESALPYAWRSKHVQHFLLLLSTLTHFLSVNLAAAICSVTS